MSSDFERVKEALNIKDIIIQETGLSMKGHHLEECPFCQHRECFSIKDSFFKCFSCDATGDVITFLELYRQVAPAEALKLAASMAGVSLVSLVSRENQEAKEGLKERIFRLAAEHYRNQTLDDSPVRDWFLKRRGHNPHTLEKLMVGMSTDDLISHLSGKGIEPEDIVKHGLAKDKDKEGKPIKPKDYFWKGLAIFPVIDHAGRIISFTSKDPEKKYPGLMLAGEKKKWFINYPALGKDELIVVEGENDVASLMDAGVDAVIGTAGSPSADQMTLIKNFCSGKTIYLWFDQDKQQEAIIEDILPEMDAQMLAGTNPRHVAARLEAIFGEQNSDWERLARSEMSMAAETAKKDEWAEWGIDTGNAVIPVRDTHPRCRCSNTVRDGHMVFSPAPDACAICWALAE